ncbi:MAG: hypothetical protein V3U06_07860 [Candidatus Binatia bacterium]
MDNLNGSFDGLNRLYQHLDGKISEKGGLDNLFGLHGKLRESLESISTGEFDTLLNEIQKSRAALDRLQGKVIDLRFLKETFTSSTSGKQDPTVEQQEATTQFTWKV